MQGAGFIERELVAWIKKPLIDGTRFALHTVLLMMSP
jgi:hypothetical protein